MYEILNTAIEQYVSVTLFPMLCKVVFTIKFGNENLLRCIFSCGAVGKDFRSEIFGKCIMLSLIMYFGTL